MGPVRRIGIDVGKSREEHTALVKQEAKRLGFIGCGISKARFLEEDAYHLENYLNKGYHGKMSYMANHFDKRLDPRKLVDGAKSVISLLLNYYPNKLQTDDAPKVSKYAYGQDYHDVIKAKLREFIQFISINIGNVEGRAFVDSAPVLDRAWAKNSGLGWIGKNGNLINPKVGSYFFIAELIIDMEFEYDTPINEYCGTCTRCIDSCPTGAIVSPKKVNGSQCISYFTIELRDEIPAEMRGKFEDWMFGCDICQDVCPWNRKAVPTQEKAFSPHPDLLEMHWRDWEELTEHVFREVFRKSAVKRTKYAGLKRNIAFLNAKDGC